MAVAAKTAAAGRIHRSTDEFARTGRSNLQAMSPASTNPAAERELLEGARQGDENAFQRLVEPHRTELHAHCYRMLGSVHDAEDALQETLLRAWRGLPRFEGRSSLRSWLYTIATNTSLNTIERRPNSALQRARATVEDRLPEQSQQATLRSLGDDRLREIVDGYVDAWQRGDVEAVVGMLTEDASFAMPPLGTWFRGSEAMRVFLAGWPLSGLWRWRPLEVRANGQVALAFYSWDDDEDAYMPFAVNGLTFRGQEISAVTPVDARSAQV